MVIKSKNTVVLQSSLQFNEAKTEVTYQANTDLYVEGNPYGDLVTQQTIFDLKCAVKDIAKIEEKTQQQIDTYIATKYPPVS